MIAPAAPRERRRLLITALATIVPFIALAAWARFASPASWEQGVVAAVALGPGIFSDLVGLINTVGNLPIWIALTAVIAVGVALARGLRAAFLVGLSLLSDVVALAVKIVVERQRPETAATEHFFGADSFAFPSGHVVRAVALVAVLAWILAPPPIRLRLALVSAVLAGTVMGYARVAIGVHWPTDALGGALLGTAWFAITACLIGCASRAEP